MKYQLNYIIPKLLRKLFNPPAINHSTISNKAKCDIGCSVSSSIMGDYSYIGEYTSLSMVEVGAYTSISSNCSIGGGDHPAKWVSTSPVFTANRSILRTNFSSNPFETHCLTHIGNDVWIGSNCVIKAGVRIADGAVVGMGSVVTHDIGPYEIWCGNPAKFLKKRFDDDTIKRLLDLQWWRWDATKIKIHAHLFNNVELFLERIK